MLESAVVDLEEPIRRLTPRVHAYARRAQIHLSSAAESDEAEDPTIPILQGTHWLVRALEAAKESPVRNEQWEEPLDRVFRALEQFYPLASEWGYDLPLPAAPAGWDLPDFSPPEHVVVKTLDGLTFVLDEHIENLTDYGASAEILEALSRTMSCAVAGSTGEQDAEEALTGVCAGLRDALERLYQDEDLIATDPVVGLWTAYEEARPLSASTQGHLTALLEPREAMKVFFGENRDDQDVVDELLVAASVLLDESVLQNERAVDQLLPGVAAFVHQASAMVAEALALPVDREEPTRHSLRLLREALRQARAIPALDDAALQLCRAIWRAGDRMVSVLAQFGDHDARIGTWPDLWTQSQPRSDYQRLVSAAEFLEEALAELQAETPALTEKVQKVRSHVVRATTEMENGGLSVGAPILRAAAELEEVIDLARLMSEEIAISEVGVWDLWYAMSELHPVAHEYGTQAARASAPLAWGTPENDVSDDHGPLSDAEALARAMAARAHAARGTVPQAAPVKVQAQPEDDGLSSGVTAYDNETPRVDVTKRASSPAPRRDTSVHRPRPANRGVWRGLDLIRRKVVELAGGTPANDVVAVQAFWLRPMEGPEVGAELTFRFTLPKSSTERTVRGEVVVVRATGEPGGPSVGVRFTDIRPDEESYLERNLTRLLQARQAALSAELMVEEAGVSLDRVPVLIHEAYQALVAGCSGAQNLSVAGCDAVRSLHEALAIAKELPQAKDQERALDHAWRALAAVRPVGQQHDVRVALPERPKFW